MIEIDICLPRKNFDVQIKESFSGGITGIYGASGSGKTSLLHAIAGLAKPNLGHVSIRGKKIFDADLNINMPVEQRNIGYVFQEGRLFPHLNIQKNLLYGVKKFRKAKISIEEVVELLNLGHLLNSKPARISGGERQRAALGRSLLSSPELLLLDEPFSAVDVNLRRQILPFILRIQQKTKIPMLVVSHDLTDLLKLSDKLCIINKGQCIGHGQYHELLKDANTASVFGGSNLVNAIDMKVVKTSGNGGMTLLSWKGETIEQIIRCEKSHSGYAEGQTIKIFIQADDIAISDKQIPNITIQNQLQGTVTDILQRGASKLCIIDAGFKLVVEITAESQKRMHIEKGSRVWCLFKSVAIDVAG